MILFLETMWCVTLFLQICLRDEYNGLISCWDKSSNLLGSWRLAPPYVAIGVALIVWPQGLWLSPVAGGMLIVLAVCHLFEICRATTRGRRDTLLPQTIPDADLERYDDISEILDDTLPSPVTPIPEDDDYREDI
ncbi:uncharacterized protein LOC113386925 [Ctenocephalides felis]|uniref:uncharacterized protein LOC113386925 n=1 Tax=Ctenocephalides felis TaxID=7515 RepID=UPI000E6E1F68|nr:uncharacterized protein LOC113386925 [Ctenocephalides felis]